MRAEWKRLNEYQLEAVTDDSPACVVKAHVGSGKTTVLIEKILYLHFGSGEEDNALADGDEVAVKPGIPLEEMVVLTFTNKAADEIISRLLEREPSLSKEQVRGFGTFHSVAMHLLKNKLPLEQTGWKRDFTVIDPDEEVDVALEIIEAHQLKVKYKNRLKKRLEQEYNGYLQGRETSRYKDDLFMVYPLLEVEKKKQNKMAFADLIRVCTELLKEDVWYPAWIIVDEVQDSDAMQLEFLSALKGPDTKFFAVGDPNQEIYSWRGPVQNTFYLLKHRFDARELAFSVNYRSNASILEAANRFLQYGNKIQAYRESESRIKVMRHYDPFQEAEYLAERIKSLHDGGSPYREIAIFYRLQKQSEILEKVLSKHDIPYEVSVKKTLKDIPVLDWLVKVLRFACHQEDELMGVQALSNALYGEKCTKKKAQDMIAQQKKEASQLYRSMLEFTEQEAWKQDGIPTVEAVFDYFGLKEALHPTAATYAEDERAVRAFIGKLCEYCRAEGYNFIDGTKAYVSSSALYGGDVSETRGEVTGSGEDVSKTSEFVAGDTVKLMTLHASKGLEFDTVFMIGVNRGLIPLHGQNQDQEEEERRLFFVGITRARNELELSYYIHPGEARVQGEYSSYLRMIPEHLLEWDEMRGDEEKRKNLQMLRKEVREVVREKQVKNEEERTETVRHARHPKYGTGVLVAEDEMMVEVEFEGYGRKQFLKAFGEVVVEG